MKNVISFVLVALLLADTLSGREFFAFDNGLNDVAKLEDKAALLAELGYDGIAWRPGQTAEMLAALDKHRLKMFSTYVTLNADQESCPIPEDVISEIKALKGRDTIVWLNVAGNSSDAVVVPAIRKLCDICAEVGLKVALYPHLNSFTDTVTTALRLVKVAERDNLGITFNLCHFLKLFDSKDLAKTIKDAAPHMWLVSINGCDDGDTRNMNWDRLIRPLGEGSFPVSTVLEELDSIGYTGAVGLQCFSIKQPAKDHLAKSAKEWKRLTSVIQEP
jgi:sugar phosphate isomerase/epimerase